MSQRLETIVAATANAGKLAEIRRILAGFEVTVRSQSEFGIGSPEETGSSFTENALIKARHAADQSRLPAIADDSGLAVDALQGRPGVMSARYAGRAANDRRNVDKLLRELEGVGEEERGASFHCIAVFVAAADDPAPLVAEGVWRGRIAARPSGSSGFGYDPVFHDPLEARTAAEMTQEEKNAVSHRGRAFLRLAELLAARGLVLCRR